MKASISGQIADLPGMSKPQLYAVWAQNFHQPPPPTLRKDLLVPILAYRIQEREYGGLSNSARKKLRDIAKSLPPGKLINGQQSTGLRSGTRLVRTWKGVVHEVDASDGVYLYRRKHYNNLSQIAREITGTRWSGPLFFGTKERKR